MANGAFCKNCGLQITGESGTERKPCPRCGSLARSFELQASPGHYSIEGASATLTVIIYPEALLTAAQGLMADGEFSIAVVVAHMACEISAERALSRALAAKGIVYLEEAIEELLPGYNLANDRVRKLYNAVTGDEIQNRPFWEAFKKSAKLRNEAVHKGKIVTQGEAEASFKAMVALVAYLK